MTAAATAILESRIAELTLRFMNGLPARLASIDDAMSRLDADPSAITELARHFHSLAGTAGTYRATEIAELAKQAEAICNALRDREENFRILCQAAFDGILVHVQGVITAVNDKCAAMFRTTPENLVGRNVLELTEPSFHEQVLRRVRERTSEPFESVALRIDGTRMPVEVCGVSKEGSTVRIVALRELIESSDDLICEHDLDGKLLFANALAAQALEIPPQEICGVNVRDVIAPGQSERFDDYLATIRATGIAEGLMTVITRSGQRRIWHYQNALRRGGADRPTVRGRARDVTEREEALQQLHRSERRFRSIIENASDMIVICDRSGVISYHSPATTRILGYELRELEGRSYRELVHAEEREATEQHFTRQAANPDKVLSGDFRVAHKDGSWRWVSVTSSCVMNAGRVQSIIVNARDITDRRLLEAQLEQAKRVTSLGQLTATVAHEFNNVLMSMQPFADLMQRPGVKPEVVAKGARHIASSIARGKRVAMDMLRFTRPAEPNLAPIDLREWWERFAPCVLATTGDNVRIAWNCPPRLAIAGDAAQLSQVFSNLISNARDAMPHGGNLSIRCRVPRLGETFSFGVVDHAHEFVQISVQDTGVGMPEHVMRHAFDPLFTTKQNSGTGLGLAVAHQVVTRHGGFIFVESTLDVGTTFHMFLPLASEAVPDEEVAEPEEPVVKARRVLLVEDEPGIREGVADTLNERGIVVAAVEAGRDAIPAMSAFAPQFAIIDIGLPDIDGLDLGRIIRKLHPSVKIIFASGHGDASRVVGECAPATFLQKPFEVRELLEAIAALEREETR